MPRPISPTNDNPPSDLLRRMARSWSLLQQVIAGSLAAEGVDDRVQPGMGLVLFALYEQDGRTVTDMAQRAHVSHVAVLQLVNRMEQARLVERRDCPEDGRATRVWLTHAGRALEERMRTVNKRNVATIMRVLGKDDAMQLHSLLGRLIEGLAGDSNKTPKVSTPRNKRTT